MVLLKWYNATAVVDPGFPRGSANPEEGGVNPKDGYANLLVGNSLAENCMKTKEISPKGKTSPPWIG